MKTILTIIATFIITVTYSQSIKIQGKTNYAPCEVILLNKQDTVWTDIDGAFKIEHLQKNDYLKFEFFGCNPFWYKVDTTCLNLNIEFDDILIDYSKLGCPTTQVMISNYYLNQMLQKDSLVEINRFDWESFIKNKFADFVFIHKTNLDTVYNYLRRIDVLYETDTLNLLNKYENCINSEFKIDDECTHYKNYELDEAERAYTKRKFGICYYNGNYSNNKYQSILASDNSKYNTKIDYKAFDFNSLVYQGFKTSCGSDCCTNILLVEDVDSTTKALDLDLFNKYYFPIDNIYKALFYINFSEQFLNAYGYAVIPFYNVKYKKTKKYFYIEHVLCMHDRQYYHVLIRIGKQGKIKILKKDKNFRFGPCY